MEKQIVAFDIGDKRVGVAFSDPFGEYAVPGETYFRTGNLAADVKALAEIASARDATLVVCGLPLNADGTESVQTEKTRRFVGALAKALSAPVVFEDERYTTREARKDLTFVGVSAKKDKRKKTIDSVAAAYILESYLAKSKKGETEMKEEQNNYEDDNLVELVDEEGNSVWYEHLMTFEYKNEWYVALTEPGKAAEEAEDENNEDEVFIYHITGEEDDETLEPIQDDAFLDEVFAEFCNQYEDFEDSDEAAALEPEEGEE